MSATCLDQLSAMIHAVYAAAEAPERWTNVLQELSAAIGARAAIIHSESHRSGNVAFGTSVGFDHRDLDRYADYYVHINPYLTTPPRGFSALRASDVVELTTAERSEYFADFLVPQRMGHPAGISIRDESGVAAMTVLPPLERRAFSEEEFQLIDRLAPHIERALRLQATIAQITRMKTAFLDALDAAGVPALLLDASWRVIAASGPARRMLATGDALITERGALRAASASERQRLERFLRKAISRDATDRGLILLRRRDGRTFQAAAGPVQTLLPYRSEPAVLLVVSDPTDLSNVDPHALETIYGLTPTEAAVAVRVVRGMTLAEIAADLGVRRSTSKTHLNNLFAKVGVSRQVDLARVLVRALTNVANGSGGER